MERIQSLVASRYSTCNNHSMHHQKTGDCDAEHSSHGKFLLDLVIGFFINILLIRPNTISMLINHRQDI